MIENGLGPGREPFLAVFKGEPELVGQVFEQTGTREVLSGGGENF